MLSRGETRGEIAKPSARPRASGHLIYLYTDYYTPNSGDTGEVFVLARILGPGGVLGYGIRKTDGYFAIYGPRLTIPLGADLKPAYLVVGGLFSKKAKCDSPEAGFHCH